MAKNWKKLGLFVVLFGLFFATQAAKANLNASQTATDIVTALQSNGAGMSSAQVTAATTYWTSIISAIYARIASDMAVKTGIPVSTTGSASAQTGATTAPGQVQ